MNMWDAIANERRRLADDLDKLADADWHRSTVCDDWDVKAIAAHLVLPFEVSKPRFMLRVIRNRRDIPKTIQQLSAKVNESMTAAQIVQSLRRNASSKWKPPGTGPHVPLGEIVVHGQDIRHAVGLETMVPEPVIKALLAAIDDDSIRADYASRVVGRAAGDNTTSAREHRS